LIRDHNKWWVFVFAHEQSRRHKMRSRYAPRLGVGDLPASHIASDLRRRRAFEAAPIPVRLLAELGEVEVVWPARILAKLACNGREFRIPPTFRLAIVDRSFRSVTDDEPKFTVEVGHVLTGPTGQESAIWARLATEPQRAALRAFDEAGDLAFESRLMPGGN